MTNWLNTRIGKPMRLNCEIKLPVKLNLQKLIVSINSKNCGEQGVAHHVSIIF